MHLWQQDSRREYELWDGKVSAIFDFKKVFGRNKQNKYLLEGYSPFEFEWINENNLTHVKDLVNAFEVGRAEQKREAKALAKSTSTKKDSSLAPLDKDAKDLALIPDETPLQEPIGPQTKFKRTKRKM